MPNGSGPTFVRSINLVLGPCCVMCAALSCSSLSLMERLEERGAFLFTLVVLKVCLTAVSTGECDQDLERVRLVTFLFIL